MTRTPPRTPTSPTAAANARKSGRAVIEKDGRSIWEWQTATGVFERDVSLEQITKLEDAGLSLIDDERPPSEQVYASTGSHRAVGKRIVGRNKLTQSSQQSDAAPSLVSRLLKRIAGRS